MTICVSLVARPSPTIKILKSMGTSKNFPSISSLPSCSKSQHLRYNLQAPQMLHERMRSLSKKNIPQKRKNLQKQIEPPPSIHLMEKSIQIPCIFPQPPPQCSGWQTPTTTQQVFKP
jgi:hypothetical protein